MKATCLLTNTPQTANVAASEIRPHLIMTVPQFSPVGSPPGETIRHILLGSPGAVQQTIHLLHRLRYSETVLWSPVVAVEEALTIAPALGEAMSLLRKQV